MVPEDYLSCLLHSAVSCIVDNVNSLSLGEDHPSFLRVPDLDITVTTAMQTRYEARSLLKSRLQPGHGMPLSHDR
jgi:hypothetical protein